jgi:hypothetical protein
MLRLLCLPGFRQSAQSLKVSSTSLQTALAPEQAELVFTEAARINNKQCWWDASDSEPPAYVGVQDSLQRVSDTWNAEGPFDGVVGFSQGAAMVSLVSSCPPSDFPGLRLAVMIGGFVPRDPLVNFAPRAGVRSLHIIGSLDNIVTPERSLALAHSFDERQIVEHGEGHVVPSDEVSMLAIKDWIASSQ